MNERDACINAARRLITAIDPNHGTLFYPDSAEILGLSWAMERFVAVCAAYDEAVAAGEIRVVEVR